MAIIEIPGFTEPFSSLSHLIAGVVFLLLSFPMLRRGWGSASRVASLAVFCFSAVLLLALSGVNHLLPFDSAGRRVLQRLDHAAIFILIASSFTPAHAILFRGVGRWGMLLLIWTIAVVAITCKMIWFEDMPPMLGHALYLGMGWIGLGSGIALGRRFGFRFVEPILLGGVAYSIGAVLDLFEWPVVINGVIHPHEVFHLFVIAGLSFHWAFNYAIADGRMAPSSRDRQDVDAVADESSAPVANGVKLSTHVDV